MKQQNFSDSLVHKILNLYSSDGASAHFKNNLSIFNLAYHKVDFDLDAASTFSATGHGKGVGDGVGAFLKSAANA